MRKEKKYNMHRIIIGCMLLLCIVSISGCQKKHDDNPGTEVGSDIEQSDRGAYLVNPELEEFTHQAVLDMLEVPVADIANATTQTATDDYETLNDFSGLTIDKPYQVAVSDPDWTSDCMNKILDIYFCSYTSQENQELYQPKDAYYAPLTETMEQTVLAGDKSEMVVDVSFRYYYMEPQSQAFLDEMDEWGTLEDTEEGTYLYGNLVLHVRMVSDHVYELCGIAGADSVVEAFAEKYPENSASYALLVPVTPKTTTTGRAKVNDGQLQITCDDGATWEDVPLSTELLFDRGDQRDGALTDVQEGSACVSDGLSVIGYGGSEDVPLSAMVSTDGGKNWNKIIVSRTYVDVRAIFVSRPADSDMVYMLITSGRTMSQEGNALFVSKDAGTSWTEIPVTQEIDAIHFLTSDFAFTDESTGFICIQDNEAPHMLYTIDGGTTWQETQFDAVDEGYTYAYAPSICEEGLELYIGQPEYSKGSGDMLRMVSTDGGLTWEEDKIYHFQ